MQRNRQQNGLCEGSSAHLRLVIARRRRRADWRRILERAWSAYPPVALLIAAAIAMAGCGSNIGIKPLKPVTRPPAAVTQGTDADGVRLAAELTPAHPGTPAVGHAAARATIRYGQGRMDLANLSQTPWRGARLWVNERYSIPVTLIRSGEVRTVRFADLLDENGNRFPGDGQRVRVTSIQLQLGDELTTVRYGLGV